MNLLMLIHRLPCPADRGAKLRAAAELRYLARRHDVWCAGFLDADLPPAAETALAEARELCRGLVGVPLKRFEAGLRAAGSLLTGRTATEGYFDARGLRRCVREWQERIRFDAVLACSSGMAPLALSVPAARRVLDFVDFDSQKWTELARASRWPMRHVYSIEARRLNRAERAWISAFDAAVVCTQREKDLLNDSQVAQRVHVIRTGSASDERVHAISDGHGMSSLPDEPVVGFVGAMDYEPNVDAACWFADSIWPQVRLSRPDARWWVVGRSPSRAVRRLDDGRSIRVTGTVPEVEPYLRHMRVSVAPLRVARGLQTKVLEAMAAGRPCVVTPCVAQGLGARSGQEVLVADSSGSFADAVIELLQDRRKAESIGRAGRSFVARHYDPAAGLAALESLLAGDNTGSCQTGEGAA